MKSKKVFSFPEHLPATLHFDIDSANRREESSEDSGEIKNESSDLLHDKLTMRPDSLEDAGNGNHMVSVEFYHPFRHLFIELSLKFYNNFANSNYIHVSFVNFL